MEQAPQQNFKIFQSARGKKKSCNIKLCTEYKWETCKKILLNMSLVTVLTCLYFPCEWIVFSEKSCCSDEKESDHTAEVAPQKKTHSSQQLVLCSADSKCSKYFYFKISEICAQAGNMIISFVPTANENSEEKWNDGGSKKKWSRLIIKWAWS